MRQLNEAELLCIKRLKGKKTVQDIADRLSLTVDEVKQIIKSQKQTVK